MPETKTTTKKQTKPAALKKDVFVQYFGNETKLADIEAAIQKDYDEVKKGKDKAKEIAIYLKPEENKVYYVVNGDYAGEINLPLD